MITKLLIQLLTYLFIQFQIYLFIYVLLLSLLLLPPENFFSKVLFSVASVIFFFFFLSVYTITLERLNQSDPNFHTRILTEIARPRTKMGIIGHM